MTAGLIEPQRNGRLDNQSVTLSVDGIPVGSKPLTLEPGGAGRGDASIRSPSSSRNMRATVKIADDALNADNSFNFVVSPSEPLRVAIVDRGNCGRATCYLTRALSIGEAAAIRDR